MNAELAQRAVRAAGEVLAAHGVPFDRKELLQVGSTVVVRLSDSVVARVVVDGEGPRQGTGWLAREIAVVGHLCGRGAPVIPLHGGLPAGPHVRDGMPMSFWQYVQKSGREPRPDEVGAALFCCHEALRDFAGELEPLAILRESLRVLEAVAGRGFFASDDVDLLRRHLGESLRVLMDYPRQALHGDAHWGNLMTTGDGVLWTDWEDAFAGPVEWDVASVICNAPVLGEGRAEAAALVSAYEAAGGRLDERALAQSVAGRVAVMTAWYPVLYPELSSGRRHKLEGRLAWLRGQK